MESRVVSKKRVTDHGEVLTGKREVNAMLDMVKQETERIDSRFLEPACGTGNFLIEILDRKLRVVQSRYKKSQLEFERYAVLAVSSIYGIDILEDNVIECRERLFRLFDQYYVENYGKLVKDDCREAVGYILGRNIIHGDALTLHTVGENSKPIIFSEWSLVRGNMMQRRDFAFHELIRDDKSNEPTLFSSNKLPDSSDLGKPVFIPEPVKTYPLTHFRKLSDVRDD